MEIHAAASFFTNNVNFFVCTLKVKAMSLLQRQDVLLVVIHVITLSVYSSFCVQ